MIHLNINTEFTHTPGGRSCASGKFSAEEFYEKHLKPAFQKAVDGNTQLIVDFDGVAGYAGSFLDEAFGRLSLDYGPSAMDMLFIKCEEQPEFVKVTVQEAMQDWSTFGAHPNSPITKGKR